MSLINKDELILNCADAYRTASGTTASVKAGELPQKISQLSGGAHEIGLVFDRMRTSKYPRTVTLYGLSTLMSHMFDSQLYDYLDEIHIGRGAVTTINSYAFYQRDKLTNVDEILASATTIGSMAFAECGIEEVNFSIKPDSISDDAFLDCTDLETIYCPWAEGEVDGAPWGAEYAEVIYGG